MPNNTFDKFKQGLDLAAHYGEFKKNAVAVRGSYKVLVVGALLGLVASLAGVWQRMSLAAGAMIQQSYPQLAHALTPRPIQFFNNFMFFVGWFSLIVLIKHLFAGRSKAAAKSKWFYFGRMLVGCAWAGMCGLGFGLMAVIIFVMGRNALAALPLTSATALGFSGASLMAVSSLAISLYIFHALLVCATFGMPLLMQNKGIKEAYIRGSAMLRQHWSFILGVYALLWPLSFIGQRIVFKVLPADGVVSIFGVFALYALWPVYWIVFIPYFKRAIRKRS